jgi:ectoine hydroxylase-related dioxygenase (phytanoyl-CoA dioxygenase family)
MDQELGPLEYVKYSQTWGDGRVGTSSSFFQSDNGKNLLYSAAEREGIQDPETSLEIVSTAGMKSGGLSIHNGKTWHGSGKNCSTNRPRRGLGLHFVPGHVRWTIEAKKSRLWSRYIPDGDEISLNEIKLPDEDFPLIWEA